MMNQPTSHARVRLSAALVAIALVAALPLAHAETGKKRALVDRVISVVNEQVILQSELTRQMLPLMGELAKIKDERERERRLAGLKNRMLEEMVNEELIIQAAEDAQISVGAKEVQAAIDDVKRQNKLDDNQFAEELRKQGFTLAEHRKTVRRSLLRMHTVNRLVRQKVSVTDEDVKARYEEMGRRSAAIGKVKLQHILLALPESPTQQQLSEAKTKAAEIIEKARGGSDWAKLALDYSDDSRTKDSAGELGWIERGSLDTEWEVIVFAMDKGEVRGPINGPRGLHVFHIADVEKTDRKPFDEVKAELRNELFHREMERETSQWLEGLRKKAHVRMML